MAKKQNERLGRGLGELLGEMENVYDKEVPKHESVVEIQVSQIHPNPFQPRKHFDQKALAELAESIKTHGLIQPIVVVEDIDGYILVAGERRWRASKLAKRKTIRAVIAKIDENQMRQHALIENIQRESLNDIELAQAYQELIEVHGLTHEALAKVVHKSRSHISNTLRLLQLDKSASDAVAEGRISAGHAKMLVGLEGAQQKMLLDSIIGQKLNVRDTERMAKRLRNELPASPSREKSTTEASLPLQSLQAWFQEQGVKCAASSHKLTLDFKSEAQINLLLEMLKK